MNKLLIVCGPTATGKTALGLTLAKKFGGEIISADSRQVYRGLDIVTGKDIPLGAKPYPSQIRWRDRVLKYYIVNGIKIWLYDVVSPDEPFNIAYWKEAADLVISDIHMRGGLPIVVGGTGLYIRSLLSELDLAAIPPNSILRNKFSDTNAGDLFDYLNKLDPSRAAAMNASDRKNPRRLIRAIEIAVAPVPPKPGVALCLDTLAVGLTADRAFIFGLIDKRIDRRMLAGAEAEMAQVINTYGRETPAMTALGYRVLDYPDRIGKWAILEKQYVRRQLTWFKKQPGIVWFDIQKPDWPENCLDLVQNWYNKNRTS
jgi:tRNA dimethylallyltransferase